MAQGRPSKYKPEYDEQARKLCLLGHTDEELAEFFEVNPDTIHEWKKVHPSFSESLKKGKAIADADVADRLYLKAIGGHKVYKLEAFVDRFGEEHTVETWTVAQPDTTACIFFLKNRQPRKWRDKVDQEITGTTNVNVNATEILKDIAEKINSISELQQEAADDC